MPIRCGSCGGTGWHKINEKNKWGGYIVKHVRCSACNGKGTR